MGTSLNDEQVAGSPSTDPRTTRSEITSAFGGGSETGGRNETLVEGKCDRPHHETNKSDILEDNPRCGFREASPPLDQLDTPWLMQSLKTDFGEEADRLHDNTKKAI